MKILVAPLNWGLGHASRCIPLIQRFLSEGHEVILGGDGESLTLLRKHFPKLRYTYLAPLNLRYSASNRQVWAMLRSFPQLIRWTIQDHTMLQALLREEPIDQVVSDNRFGLFVKRSQTTSNNLKQPQTIYITHQLHIFLPRGWKWAERIASRIHARIYTRYNKVWVPDYADPQHSLAGELSHPQNVQCTMYNVQYIGPLSRFSLTAQRSYNETVLQRSGLTAQRSYTIVAVLSGLEPHRTLLEQEILARYATNPLTPSVLIVQGLMNRPNTRIKRGNITIVPYMNDAELVPVLRGAKHVIARSGYSTIMDFHALDIMEKTELIPTPGQPEQEYLATLHSKMK